MLSVYHKWNGCTQMDYIFVPPPAPIHLAQVNLTKEQVGSLKALMYELDWDDHPMARDFYQDFGKIQTAWPK